MVLPQPSLPLPVMPVFLLCLFFAPLSGLAIIYDSSEELAGYPIQGVKSIVWHPVIDMSWCSVINVECRPRISWRICSHCHCTAFLFHHPLSVQRSLIEFQCKGAEGFSLKGLHVGWWVHCRFVYFWLNIEHMKRWFKYVIMAFPSRSDIQ